MARPTATSSRPRASGGFTYLGVLLALALVGTGLAAVGQLWSMQVRRERERELLWVGGQIRAAIASYYERSPMGTKQYPADLADLIEDRRAEVTRRHLRRLYADPMTGLPDWELIRTADGALLGVASASRAVPLKRARFEGANEYFEGSGCYCDWRFVYLPQLMTGTLRTASPEQK